MNNKVPDEVVKEIFPKKVKKQQASETVYVELKKMILSGKLKKGQRLTEETLALRFNVSRQPIRRAFTQLKTDGLIKWERKAGASVV